MSSGRVWAIRLGFMALILAVSITVSVLVSPWFFMVLLIFPFEFLLPFVRNRDDRLEDNL